MTETPEQKRARVKQVIAALKKAHPDAKLALNFSNPLELLIALILAAQARDDLVNEVTPALFQKHLTPAAWAKAKPEKLEQHLRRINFFRNKTRSIQSACRALVERFGGEVPARLDDLLTLPGVGRKTANIVLGNAFGQPAIGVDTHVWRLSQRLGFSARENPDDIEAELTPLVPEKDRVKFCHLLQFHGRRVCQAKGPKCPECTIRKLCPFPNKAAAAA
jgi:endonuclease-3